MSIIEDPFKNSAPYKRMKENSKMISRLLWENEQLFRGNGYDPPSSNVMFGIEDGIRFPANYIRQADYFRDKYHLIDIFVKGEGDAEGKNIADNCAYALIESDLYNFIINRFGFWGVVASLIYKNGIINFVSIIEAMVLEGTKKYASKCNHCTKKSICAAKIVSADLKKRTKSGNRVDISFAEIVDLMEEKGFVRNPIVVFDTKKGEENVYEKLKMKKDVRNYVHITKADVNSLNNDQFNLPNYNECLFLFQIFSAAIYEKIAQQYKCFERELDIEG